MVKILQKNEKILHQKAHEVLLLDIKKNKIKKVLKEMSRALKSQGDGVAIAAPQIGYPLRIFIISGKIFTKDFAKKREERLGQNSASTEKLPARSVPPEKVEVKKDLVFINPKISKRSREREWMPEGCLSVRPYYGRTYRSKKVILSAYDENGKKFERGASGLLAQIFQHETDHLEGILFIDHAKDIKKEIPK
jgi:peptide deformylase